MPERVRRPVCPLISSSYESHVILKYSEEAGPFTVPPCDWGPVCCTDFPFN